MLKKSRIQETKHLLTNADSSTNMYNKKILHTGDKYGTTSFHHFPQGFPISKKFERWTSGSGDKKMFK